MKLFYLCVGIFLLAIAAFACSVGVQIAWNPLSSDIYPITIFGVDVNRLMGSMMIALSFIGFAGGAASFWAAREDERQRGGF